MSDCDYAGTGPVRQPVSDEDLWGGPQEIDRATRLELVFNKARILLRDWDAGFMQPGTIAELRRAVELVDEETE